MNPQECPTFNQSEGLTIGYTIHSGKLDTDKTYDFRSVSIYSVCVLTSTRHDIKVYPHLQANKTNCGVYIQSIDI